MDNRSCSTHGGLPYDCPAVVCFDMTARDKPVEWCDV